MADDAPTTGPQGRSAPGQVLGKARGALHVEAVQAQIFRAISVQRPAVLQYLRSLRRDKPEATAAELLKELDRRYVTTVTTASTGVGASAAIPGVGVPVALGLGVADLMFFYETSALYVLAVAELHGIAVDDPARARPLVFGMLLGEKSQSQVTKLVMGAIPGMDDQDARTVAAGVAGKALPSGWGEALTQQLPDSALAPVLTVLAREALKTGGKLTAGTLGKAVPFGVGAVIGGVGSFTFGRDVVKASRLAFPDPPAGFPPSLDQVAADEGPGEPSRAVLALQKAAVGAATLGGDLRDAVTRSADVFRSVDLDGDGVPDEARALSAVKGAASAVKGAAGGASGAVGAVFSRRRGRPGSSGADGGETAPDLAGGSANLGDVATDPAETVTGTADGAADD
ncbi:hypothetical protein J1G44_06240 [Cellulomonas sp. zg-ZUI199]|uniref:EcsC family protein n=1 Tax=Cellulomonas wangleii TaxID=2816956 RepID=A0ABX8D4X9_9CELL|nr:hypothetical protein [Cellulomonas wangleii]MBO0923796.1 hypothetical protein [Cellulomonas wangleii]MBO0924078.1 hypothetical protein [Cellulomonas wangleii]QVI62103.1 hypothetical protein KG103_17085 [Cellulomonas wangleii]